MERRTRQGKLAVAASLGQRIEHWRRAGRPGKRMPEELWEAAALLAGEHGACRVAGDLGLNYTALKRRTANASGAARRGSNDGEQEQAEFVEIDVAGMRAHGESSATEITLERSDGSRLRLRLGAGQRLDVEAVTAAFVGGAR